VAGSMKMAVFWVVAPCRRMNLPVYTALQHRSQPFQTRYCQRDCQHLRVCGKRQLVFVPGFSMDNIRACFHAGGRYLLTRTTLNALRGKLSPS
jgi:hypothetical protein